MNDFDLEWIEQKRREVSRMAERIDQRGHDAPRFLRIIDELMRSPCDYPSMVIRELGRTWDE